MRERETGRGEARVFLRNFCIFVFLYFCIFVFLYLWFICLYLSQFVFSASRFNRVVLQHAIKIPAKIKEAKRCYY